MGDAWGHGGDTNPRLPPVPSGDHPSPLPVLIIPLVDKDSGTVICVILVSAGTRAGLWGDGDTTRTPGSSPHTPRPCQVHCGQLSDPDEQNLRALERHVSHPQPGDLPPPVPNPIVPCPSHATAADPGGVPAPASPAEAAALAPGQPLHQLLPKLLGQA